MKFALICAVLLASIGAVFSAECAVDPKATGDFTLASDAKKLTFKGVKAPKVTYKHVPAGTRIKDAYCCQTTPVPFFNPNVA